MKSTNENIYGIQKIDIEINTDKYLDLSESISKEHLPCQINFCLEGKAVYRFRIESYKNMMLSGQLSVQSAEKLVNLLLYIEEMAKILSQCGEKNYKISATNQSDKILCTLEYLYNIDVQCKESVNQTVLVSKYFLLKLINNLNNYFPRYNNHSHNGTIGNIFNLVIQKLDMIFCDLKDYKDGLYFILTNNYANHRQSIKENLYSYAIKFFTNLCIINDCPVRCQVSNISKKDNISELSLAHPVQIIELLFANQIAEFINSPNNRVTIYKDIGQKQYSQNSRV